MTWMEVLVPRTVFQLRTTTIVTHISNIHDSRTDHRRFKHRSIRRFFGIQFVSRNHWSFSLSGYVVRLYAMRVVCLVKALFLLSFTLGACGGHPERTAVRSKRRTCSSCCGHCVQNPLSVPLVRRTRRRGGSPCDGRGLMRRARMPHARGHQHQIHNSRDNTVTASG